MKQIFLIQMFTSGGNFASAPVYLLNEEKENGEFHEFPTQDHAKRYLIREADNLPNGFYYKVDNVFKHA